MEFVWGYKIVTINNETFNGTKLILNHWNSDTVRTPIVYKQGFHFASSPKAALRAKHQRKLHANQKFIEVFAPRDDCDCDGDIYSSIFIFPMDDDSIREKLNLLYGNPKIQKIRRNTQ